ncbi:MAG: TIGR02584 family CRISPR-associated protein [Gammaproteobacteria bacterium]|nr:TIGR02584 family CRISPR-associated protein [Gammaproteobacteria bacterium]
MEQHITMTHRLASDYSRRILVAVCGLSPQIVTETLYGLTVNSANPFMPTDICLITTREGRHRARLSLLHQQDGYFHRLCRDYGLKNIRFNEESIHIIRNCHGDELSDIRSESDNEAAADTIIRLIRHYTNDDDAAIHASIAGGRKTMGYYLGYAMSIFGRDQDCLSHVLVAEHYENHPDFFYPTRESRVIHTRENRPLDTRDADVILADIPFLRMREDIPQSLLIGETGFSETVKRTTLFQKEQPRLTITPEFQLLAGSEMLNLQPSNLAFYLWLLSRSVQDESPITRPHDIDPNREYSQQFLNIYRQVRGVMASIDRTENALLHGMGEGFCSEWVTRINKEIDSQLGKRGALPYRIHSGPRGTRQYSIELSSAAVVGLERLDLG